MEPDDRTARARVLALLYPHRDTEVTARWQLLRDRSLLVFAATGCGLRGGGPRLAGLLDFWPPSEDLEPTPGEDF